MSLPFQKLATSVITPTQLRTLEGPIINIMQPMLTGVQDGTQVDVPRTIWTPEQLFKGRVSFPDGHDRQLLRDNYFFLALAAIGDPDGSGEVVLGSYQEPRVREMIDTLNPKSEIVRGALPVSGAVYREIKKNGGHVIASDLGAALRGNALAEPAKRRAIFEFMAGGRRKLVDQNLALIPGTIENSMAFYPANVPGMRLVVVSSVGFNRSYAYGLYNLDSYNGRLVGVVAPEAQETARSAARAIVPASLNVGGLVDALYSRLGSQPLTGGITKKGLREAVIAYQRSLE